MPPNLVNVFSGNPLDRVGDLRENVEWLATQHARDDGLCLAVWNDQVLITGTVSQEHLVWLDARRAQALAGQALLFLGQWKDVPVFAAAMVGPDDPTDGLLADLGRFIDLRTAAAVLPGPEAAMAGTARSLFDWHARHGFCSVCGGQTQPVSGGWKRKCDACESQHFPRVDPVAIMLPVYEGGDEPRCLLGRQAVWPKGRMSALAGFIEPGESIEEGCAREVLEEAGLHVVSTQYHSSQPWPFPHQLMIGLICQVDSDQAHANQTELEAVTWLTRVEAKAVLDGRHPDILAPPPFAIAHQLIRAWAG